MKHRSHSAFDTSQLAERLAQSFVGGEVVLLYGEMGSGKTVFCKGIAKGLGIKSAVTSPTFVVFNVYQGKRLRLCHCDAYRLLGSEDAESTGLTDYLGDKNTVCVIEWPQHIAQLLDGLFGSCTSVIKVQIDYVDEKTREINLC